MIRYVIKSNPTAVISAHADMFPNPTGDESLKKVDVGTTASLAFPNDVTGSIACHMFWPGRGPFGLIPRVFDLSVVATCEGGSVKLTNFIMPHVRHAIIVTPTNKEGRTESAYTFKDGHGKGEDWWTS